MRRTNQIGLRFLLILALCWFSLSLAYSATYTIEQPKETIGVCPDDLPYYWHNTPTLKMAFIMIRPSLPANVPHV